MWLSLLLALGAKTASCGESLCLLGPLLVGADTSVAWCGDPDDLVRRLQRDGEADLEVFAFAQPRDADRFSAQLAACGFPPSRDRHFGGVERGRVRVTRGSVFAFIDEMKALGRCVYGRSVLAAPRADKD